MKKFLLIAAVLMLSVDCGASADVLGGLLERIDAGLSDKMIVEVVPDTLEWFEITQRGDRPAVRGSSIVNAAAGIYKQKKSSASKEKKIGEKMKFRDVP